MSQSKFRPNGYTPQLAKAEVLGRCRITPSDGYFTYQRSMEMARAAQPKGWKPTKPATDTARGLYAAVAKALRLKNLELLKFYSAIDSPLGVIHHRDGWFEYHGKVVTIDITMRRDDDFGSKADFVIPFASFEDENKLAEIAKRIALWLGVGQLAAPA